MSSIEPLTRRHLIVRGRVQGVGFRWFARETAESLGLTGWICNQTDGSVEAEAEGTPSVLDEFVRLLRTNSAARVDSIDMESIAARGDRKFLIG